MVEPLQNKLFGISEKNVNGYNRFYFFPSIFNIVHIGFEILVVII